MRGFLLSRAINHTGHHVSASVLADLKGAVLGEEGSPLVCSAMKKRRHERFRQIKRLSIRTARQGTTCGRRSLVQTGRL